MGEIIGRPVPPIPMPFSGERLTSEYGGQTEIEHLHRYLLAREWCRGKDVLDVASGEGYGTALLAQVARSTLGVEIAPDAVEHATSSYTRENLIYVQGDARALPVPDASRDVVVSFETIEHFAEQQQFLDEVRRVLRPGGLFIVSTPDRDNYSPIGSPVNTYHVKEMTGSEFEELLRLNFAEISFALQRPVFGSVILPTLAGPQASLCFERRGARHFEGSVGLARPQYFIAFASDGPAAALPSSVYIDSGRLGMLNPEDSAARLEAAQAAATAEREAHLRMRQATDAIQERVATLVADLAACQVELAAARGEAKGLLAANEMTEKACAAYQVELAAARAEAKSLLAANEMTEKACAAYRVELAAARAEAKSLLAASEITEKACAALRGELALRPPPERVRGLEIALANIQMSHSWRVTAPLRQISRMLYRRP